MKFAFLIADDMEFKPLCELSKKYNGVVSKTPFNDEKIEFTVSANGVSADIMAIKCGIGKENAAAAAAYAVCSGAQAIVNFGLSGAISGVKIDDIVIGTEYVISDADVTPLGYEKGVVPGFPKVFEADSGLVCAFKEAALSAICGRLCCGDVFVGDAKLKNMLKSEFAPVACDMESGAIALVAYKAGVPCVSVRQISDNADDVANETYTENNNLSKPDLSLTAVNAVISYISK